MTTNDLTVILFLTLSLCLSVHFEFRSIHLTFVEFEASFRETFAQKAWHVLKRDIIPLCVWIVVLSAANSLFSLFGIPDFSGVAIMNFAMSGFLFEFWNNERIKKNKYLFIFY